MAKKQMLFKTKGMNQDLSVSAFNPEFAFENINLRLSTNEGNTLMSWVNEKGTEEIELKNGRECWEKNGTIVYEEPDPNTGWTHYDEGGIAVPILGVPVGTAVIDHKLIVFTTGSSETNKPDTIYVVQKESNGYTSTAIFKGNLNLDSGHPLETLVSYETTNIQKVYWTDNYNQPRVANIADLIKNPIENASGEIYTKFDFVTAVDLSSSIQVTKRDTGGIFAPGVIQYCYTYFNKYGQQSNIVNVSPLYYLTNTDRGASPEDKVSNSFEIQINTPDANFDMVRLYSIHRTSLNSVPIVLALEDLPISSGVTIRYIDTGSAGSTVDPTELLFIGGKEITALTMEEKDQTLFLGNIEEQNVDISKIQKYYDDKRGDQTINYINFHNGETVDNVVYNEKEYNLADASGRLYSNTFTLKDSHRDITTFKGGDYYRFGFQLQKYTGEWSEPIFLRDEKNTKYPRTSVFDTKVNLVYATSTLNLNIFTQETIGNAHNDYYIKDFAKIYKRVRPVIVYPDIQDRVTLCQGVLNPTVFNAADRMEGIPFAQSSWFFRPYTVNAPHGDNIVHTGEAVAPTGTTSTIVQVIIVRMWDEDARDAVKHRRLRLITSPIVSYVPFYAAMRWKEGTIKRDGADAVYADMIFLFKGPDTSTTVAPDADLIDGLATGELRAETKHNPNTDYYNTHLYVSDSLEPSSFSKSLIVKETVSDESAVFIFNMDSGAVYGGTVTERQRWAGSYTLTFYKNNAGNNVAFTHYDSVYTDEDTVKIVEYIGTPPNQVPVKENYSNSLVKYAEVQGSVKMYDTPFSDSQNPDTQGSNNQFFVDQSIVTLHSPDLDLDTFVQNYTPGGAKLRIIGMVPITASASAHNIATSSSMLPINYQTEEDDEGEIHESTDFGAGELDVNTYWLNKNVSAGKRLVSEYMWEDAAIGVWGGKVHDTWDRAAHYLIYPWQASRSLTSDIRGNGDACSVLKSKVESNIFYSYNTPYFESNNPLKINSRGSDIPISEFDLDAVATQFHLQENEFIENIRLTKQVPNFIHDINYYSNIDKALVNPKQWRVYAEGYSFAKNVNASVLMRYKSGTHAVVALKGELYTPDDPLPQQSIVDILPYMRYDTIGSATIDSGRYFGVSGNVFWGDENVNFAQEGLDISGLLTEDASVKPFDCLWLGELYKDIDDPNTLFGGSGRQALKANTWLVGGDAVPLTSNNINQVPIIWSEGDTYYQRYDCLKTYPFSTEDPNQLVEILSFMCETHVNLDGRYDRNRGQRDNTNVMPQNFNLMNQVYNQKDNFFSYKKTDSEASNRYPNMVVFTKTKESGADVDQWTNITLASNLELDGSRGEISSIQRLNNQLFAFQDTGISQILYNESVQISSTEGVPIEIANSQNVQGKRYYSNSIGCSNKHSICNTPSGIYFIDSNDKGIYLFNGELNNLSNKFGFNTWCKTNIFSNRKWTPVNFEDFVTYYDRQNQDVLFINEDTALAFSEKLGVFTSFYDYGKAPYFCNLDDEGLWINVDNSSDSTEYKLWKHRGGNYCSFFGESKPYSTILIGNPEPLLDKTFTNLEFRACVGGDGETTDNRYLPYLPFDSLETWNEYQHGVTNLKGRDGHNPYRHHDGADSTLLRKFRIWRCDIPRDNFEFETYPIREQGETEKEYQERIDAYNAWLKDETDRGIFRTGRHINDRMRNPWIYLKMFKEEDTDKKTEIHDVVMTYFD